MIRGFIVSCLLPAAAVLGASVDAGPGDVGLERGAKVVLLPRGDYAVAPQDDSTPLLLMIDSVKPEQGGRFAYAIRSLGFESGDYRLADFLVHPDGTRAEELGDLRMKVTGLLPADHDGRMNAFSPAPLPWFGGYRAALIMVVALWVAALPAIIWVGRKRKVAAAPAPVERKPSRMEQMRPLVLAASEGRLDASGRAELERLMTGHWRETFGPQGGGMGERIAAMRRHPEAGPLLVALERWLHDPAGAAPGEIDALLAPYGRAPGNPTEGGAA